MFEQNNLTKRRKEIERENEAFDRHRQSLLDALGMTPHDIHQALGDATQHSARERAHIEEVRQELDERFEKGGEASRFETKDSSPIPPWALFCR